MFFQSKRIIIVEEDTNSLVLQEVFGSDFSLAKLPNYANQEIPNYITEDNT